MTCDKQRLGPDYQDYTNKQLVLKATQLADRVRRKIEEWGIVTVSTPVIMPMNSRFSIGKDADFPLFQYYLNKAETSVQGSVAQFTQQAFSNSLGLQASPTVLPVPVPAPGGTVATTTTTTTTAAAAATPAPSTAGAAAATPAPSNYSDQGANVTAPANSLLGNFASQQFAAPGALLTTKPTGLSERQAMMIAANDMAAQAMLREMASPHDENNDVYINFAMVEISCNPGWRTKESYLADCSAYCEYWNPATGTAMALNERDQPMVYSVLPLLDAQTLDMANSERQLTSLVAQISAAFPVRATDIRAKDLIQFAKSFQRDAASRNAIPVVNSYSSGRTFGFRFSPSFRALKDPAVRKSGTANVLTPTSFPALVTIVCRKATIDALGDMLSISKTKDPRIVPQIMTHVSTRWLLADRPKLYQVFRWLSWPALEREDTGMRMDLARDVDETYKILDYLTHEQEVGTQSVCYTDPKSGKRVTAQTGKAVMPATANYELEELRRNVTELEAKGIGQSHPFDLFSGKPVPQTDDDSPAITAIAPTVIQKDKPVTIAILGKNFSNEMQIILGGRVVHNAQIYADSLITATLPPNEWPPGTIVANKQTVVPVILVTDSGAVVDTSSLTVQSGGTETTKPTATPTSDGNSNEVSVALGETVVLSKVTVEAVPKPKTAAPTISPNPPNKIAYNKPVTNADPTKATAASFDITVTGTGLDSVAGAKLVKDKSNPKAVDPVGLSAASISPGGSATQLTVHVDVTNGAAYTAQSVCIALYKSQNPADTDTPLVTSKAVSLATTP